MPDAWHIPFTGKVKNAKIALGVPSYPNKNACDISIFGEFHGD